MNPPLYLDSGDIRRLKRSIDITAFYQFPGTFEPVAELFTAENKGVNFWIGAAIARHPSGSGLILADATSIARKAIGLATVGAAVGFAESVQLDGVFTMNDWTNVTGSASLQPLADYFLSVTPGMLSSTSPNVPGQIAQPVGFAISPTTLMVNPEPPIQL